LLSITVASVREGDLIGIGSRPLVVRGGQIDEYIDDAVALSAADMGVTVEQGRKQLLGHISFTLNPGQLLAVIGPSGAGKNHSAARVDWRVSRVHRCGDLQRPRLIRVTKGATLPHWLRASGRYFA
jgi:hypothetical protein